MAEEKEDILSKQFNTFEKSIECLRKVGVLLNDVNFTSILMFCHLVKMHTSYMGEKGEAEIEKFIKFMHEKDGLESDYIKKGLESRTELLKNLELDSLLRNIKIEKKVVPLDMAAGLLKLYTGLIGDWHPIVDVLLRSAIVSIYATDLGFVDNSAKERLNEVLNRILKALNEGVVGKNYDALNAELNLIIEEINQSQKSN